MLPRRLRISNKKQFQKAYKNGIKVKGEYQMMVGLLEDRSIQGEFGVKLGIVVGKKVAKKAVERNLIKRRISSILYSYIKENDLEINITESRKLLSISVIAFEQIVECESFKELQQDIKNVFSKLLKKINYKTNSSIHNKNLSENSLS